MTSSIYPCVFCMDDNSHARAYPVSGEPGLLYCPTCRMMFDQSELEVKVNDS